MVGAVSFRRPSRKPGIVLASVGVAVLLVSVPQLGTGQVHGVPPSVTSTQFHVPPFLPNIMPSVTSLGPSPFTNHAGPIPAPYGVPRSIYAHGIYRRAYKNAYGYSGGYAYPYYAPAYDMSAGYDSGPYLYSAPPAEQTLHIVVDTQPARHEVGDDIQDSLPPLATNPPHPADAGPVAPTLLIFRDGHKQEVSNYAIMGQTLYVFDVRTQKIALGDLDVPATIKVNDDRGVEFHLPNAKQS
jgi:hypothetical protein